ncbi:hypothetical protein AJ78_01901 [Emergomyces pasteurianus Ep9510]|uniref:Uncharacterized protein n=1 Tax=Emergomyces pasteurianus Ep9510 TaxID=1447872 RepID=A0A1J9QPI3_9EURO|nr:hypothetical protein AJ78_01901 [Emergomyces pasteurianus Ep9510]
MKLSALVTSTLVLGAFASPIVDTTTQRAGKNFRQIPMQSPPNWIPGPGLLSVTDSTFSTPSSAVSAAGWTNILRGQCVRVTKCVGFAGYLKGGEWHGSLFRRGIHSSDFIRDPHASHSFAFTSASSADILE